MKSEIFLFLCMNAFLDYILDILNIVIRLWILFKSYADVDIIVLAGN